MSETWRDRIETIASNLLTLEINTAIKPGMVAQKMPEPPVALHVLIETYAEGLSKARVPLTGELLRAAAAHLRNDAAITVEVLQSWFTAPGGRPKGYEPETPVAELTNGAETFEAMQWAAFGGLATGAYKRGELDNAEVNLQRIRSNSRQLRSAAILLERQYSSAGTAGTAEPGAVSYEARLDAVRSGKEPEAESRRLFGGTLEQTADALFKHPRPPISIAPDLAVLVRKAWDVGLEAVLFQTVIQLDGDMLARMSDQISLDQRDFLHGLHQQVVGDGTAQWKLLFQTAGELIRETGALLFGKAGRG